MRAARNEVQNTFGMSCFWIKNMMSHDAVIDYFPVTARFIGLPFWGKL